MPDGRRVASELSCLPDAAAKISAATVQAAQAVIKASAEALEPGLGLPLSIPVIRSVQADLRLYLDVEGEKIVFFFWREPVDRVRSMSARLQLSMIPVPERPPGAPAAGEGRRPTWSLLAPPFLVAAPSDQDITAHAPPGARAEDVVLLRIGPGGRHVLAVERPERGTKARAAYTLDRRLSLDSWLAKPFLDLVEAMRRWLSEETADGAPFTVAMPALTKDMTHVQQVLHHLADACSRARAEADTAAKSLPAEPWAALVPRYEPADFAATVDLRLRSSGQLAGPDEPMPICLRLVARVVQEGGALAARATLLPSGFVAGGELLGAFLGAVRGAAGELLEALGMKDDETWAAFVDEAAPLAAVLRDLEDAVVIVLPGHTRLQRRTLVLVAKAEVDEEARPPAVTLGEVELAYDSVKDEDKALDDGAVKPFLRLIASMKSWLALFPRRR